MHPECVGRNSKIRALDRHRGPFKKAAAKAQRSLMVLDDIGFFIDGRAQIIALSR